MRSFVLPSAALSAVAVSLAVCAAQAAGSHRHAPAALRLTPTESAGDVHGAGVVRFSIRRGATYATARFAHLASDTTHTLAWTGDDGAHPMQFVTDHHGRGMLRNVAVPQDAIAGGAPAASVMDDQGTPVLACDADAAHAGTADPPPAAPPVDPPPTDPPGAPPTVDPPSHAGCPSGGATSCCTQCSNGGTCDPQTCRSDGCTCSCCCGTQGGQQQCGGMSSGSSASGGSSSGGASGSTSGGMMHR